MEQEHWQPARLIPVSGIKGDDEQERRATSALLAVLTAVHEFERAVLKPLGAPSGKLSAFCEVPFELADGRNVRVDGVLQAVRGKRTWTLLVEVKTGNNELKRDQIEAYLDVVKQEDYAGLLTISNQLASVYGHHPVDVDGRRYRKVNLHHLSWTRILASALMVNDHIGVEDPDQKWILGELIRYLQDDKSGARTFADMGREWNPLRKALREGTLRRGDDVAQSVAMRWEQLLQHISLDLAARLGGDVHPVFSRKEASDPALRTATLSKELTDSGTLSGAIAIPNTVAPIAISADLRTMDASVSVTLGAPDLAKSSSRLSWLLRQLRNAPDDLRIDVAFERTQTTASDLLGNVRANPRKILTGMERPPRAFTVAQTERVGGGKRRSVSGNFVEDMGQLVDAFYRDVVQGLKAWSPPAPRLPEADESAEQEQPEPPPPAEPAPS